MNVMLAPFTKLIGAWPVHADMTPGDAEAGRPLNGNSNLSVVMIFDSFKDLVAPRV